MVVCHLVGRPRFVKVMILWVRYWCPAGFCKFYSEQKLLSQSYSCEYTPQYVQGYII